MAWKGVACDNPKKKKKKKGYTILSWKDHPKYPPHSQQVCKEEEEKKESVTHETTVSDKDSQRKTQFVYTS